MNKALFREEAVQQQQDRLSGSVILSQPLRARLLGLGLTIITVIAVCFLSINSYARKVSVNGRLVPSEGLISIMPPVTGQLAQVFVNAGDAVQAGDPLFKLQLDHTLQTDSSVSAALLDSLAIQEQTLQQQLKLQDELVVNISEGQAEKEQLLTQSQQQLVKMLGQGRRLLDVRENAVQRALQLNKQSLLSLADLEAVQAQALQQQQACDDLQLRILQTSTAIQELQSQRNASLLQAFQQAQQLQSQLADIQQRQVRLSTEQVTTVYAPVTGRVSSQYLKQGMSVQPQQVVMSLLPAGSELQAELTIPSAAVGFLNKEQAVFIRFDAFPYQKFGTQQAHIIRVPDSAEPEQRYQNPDIARYQAMAQLDKQSVTAYGNEQALRAGMEFTADVVLEYRSLLEWLLEPLFSIRGYEG